jgi:hypothetical protein
VPDLPDITAGSIRKKLKAGRGRRIAKLFLVKNLGHGNTGIGIQSTRLSMHYDGSARQT